MKRQNRSRRILVLAIACVIAFMGTWGLLNMQVTWRKGINYHWYTLKIPLYLKLLNFFDRHYNYQQLVKEILQDVKGEEEQVMKIFAWTHEHIRPVPAGFPVIDDHTWYIIVRGYGAADQAQDVFATLCNYARLQAFFYQMNNPVNGQKKSIAFVRVKGKWCAFDAYQGVYFRNIQGEFAGAGELREGKWQLAFSSEKMPGVDYQAFFNHLDTLKFEQWVYSKAAIQSPFNRVFLGTRKK